jgi:hypothetical protein
VIDGEACGSLPKPVCTRSSKDPGTISDTRHPLRSRHHAHFQSRASRRWEDALFGESRYFKSYPKNVATASAQDIFMNHECRNSKRYIELLFRK